MSSEERDKLPEWVRDRLDHSETMGISSEDRDKLPEWAKDRLDHYETMGSAETSAPPLALVGCLLATAFYGLIIVLICALLYVIGKAVIEA